MEKKVLYRKYRPIDFNNVIGQKHVIKTLINEIKTDKTVHAYIFAGPKGSGKTSIAKIFSRAINCLSPSDGNPCNTCKNCLSIINNNSIDFVELDAASNSGVDEIRNLIDSIEYVPSELKNKVYIIDEAHMLTVSSWNALLKSIEEPPTNVVFIFATTEYNKIPPTIVSRSERFDFYKISINELKKLLNDVCELEKIKITPIALDIIATLSDGAARDALSILEQMRSYSNDSINENDLYEMFGLVDLNAKIQLLNLILDNNVNELIIMINNLELKGVNFYHLLVELAEILMDVYIYHSTKNFSLLRKISQESQITQIKFDPKIISIVNLFNNELFKLKNSEKPRFDFEFIILQAVSSLFNVQQSINNNIELNNKKKDDNMINPKDLNLWRKSTSTEPFDGPSIKLSDTDIEVEDEQFAPPVATKDLFKTKTYKIENNAPNKMNATVALDQPWDNTEQPKTFASEPKQTRTLSDKPKTKSLDDDKQNNALPMNIKDDFLSVAHNHISTLKEEHNSILEKLKEDSDYETSPIINTFLKLKKFLIVSPNGAFILMDNKTLADNFNAINGSKEFLKYYKNHFNKIQKVIAIDKELAQSFLDEYKNLKHETFNDVKIIDNDEEEKQKITESLLDILND